MIADTVDKSTSKGDQHAGDRFSTEAADLQRQQLAATGERAGSAAPKAEPASFILNGPGDMQHLYGSSARRGTQAATAAEREGQRDVRPDSGTAQAKTPVEQARTRLNETAEAKFHDHPQALKNFQQDMADFEKRMGNSPEAQAEIQRTYAQMTAMLDNGSRVMPERQHLEIAGQVMHSAAHPESITQGWSNCCEADGLETRLYVKAPSQAVALMSEMTRTGQYHTQDGLSVTLDRNTLLHNQHGVIPPEYLALGFKERNQADQIFQSTIRNVELADINRSAGSQLRYEVGKLDADHPTGERVIDHTPGLPKDERDQTAQHPGMHAETGDLISIWRSLTGTTDTQVGMSFSGRPDNLEDFRTSLEAARRSGSFPMLIGVHSDQEPFKSQMRIPDGQDSGHVIIVTNYDPATGMVQYRNPYLGDRTFSISSSQLLDDMHQHFTEKDTKGVADLINNGRYSTQDLHDMVVRATMMVAPSQRGQFLADLGQQTHRDLSTLLSNDERDRLGIGRDFFGRIGHALGMGD